MAHPKETIKRGKTVWHLEDTVSKRDSLALKRHLKHTEEKKVMTSPAPNGKRNVWWAKK
jgi:hypothetical protein